MNRTHMSLYYLCTYLLLGGFVLLFFPAGGLKLFFATGDYGTVFPRVAGMLLAGLGMFIVAIIYTRSEALYPTTLVVRTFFLACLAAFFQSSMRKSTSKPPFIGSTASANRPRHCREKPASLRTKPLLASESPSTGVDQGGEKKRDTTASFEPYAPSL